MDRTIKDGDLLLGSMDLRVIESMGNQLHVVSCLHVGTFFLFLASSSLLAVCPVPLRLAMGLGLGVGVVLAPPVFF